MQDKQITAEQKQWFIMGAMARSEDCGCSACNQQFQQALEASGFFTEAEVTTALQQHPK